MLFSSLAVLFSYYVVFVSGNYEVIKQIPCDPKNDSCFVSDCEGSDSSCGMTTTYKKIFVISNYAGSDYDSLSCPQNSPFCRIINCEDNKTEAGEKCFK